MLGVRFAVWFVELRRSGGEGRFGVTVAKSSVDDKAQ